MKKLLIPFCVVIITLLCSICVFAADTDDSGMWEYEAYGTGVKLTAYKGTQTDADVYVPSKITKGDTDYTVLKLDDNLFKENTALNSATLGDGITEIGASAFEGAKNLVCIVTPESLTTIGANAFSGCTNFNSVILYDAVTNIGENAFSGCDNLTIYCNENTTAYSYVTENGIDYKILNPDAEPEIVTIDGIEYYILNGEASPVAFDKSITTITIPSTVKGYPVTDLRNTFSDCTSIQSVTLPENLKIIGNNEFKGCINLRSIKIPSSVTKIGNYAFNGCHSLTNIEMPSSVISIGNHAFEYCAYLTNIVIPNGVVSIGNSAFANCSKLTSIELPDSLVSMGDQVFYRCKKFASIKIPNSVTSIGGEMFYECSKLTSVEMSDNVTSIGVRVFHECTSLTSIEIPNSVTYIGSDSFPTTTVMIVEENSYAHTFAQENELLYFIATDGVEPEIYIQDGITYYIMNGEAIAISAETSLTDVIIPEKVKEYPVTGIRTTFKSHTLLKSIILPDGVTSIVDDAFYNCTRLTSIEIPNSVTLIGDSAFYCCTSLMNIKIPSGLKSIGREAFAYCKKLENIKLPNSVTSIGVRVFRGCSSLTSIEIPDSVTSIGDEAFRECTSLTSIKIPDNVTSIDDFAFYECTSLASIEIPDSVTSIGSFVFYNCQNLISIKIPQSVTYIAANSFPDTIVLIVEENSYAHTFAQKNELLYFIATDGVDPEIYTQDGITYCVAGGEAIAISAETSLTCVIIPEKVKEYPVTDIRTTFKLHTSLKSITLPKNITSIDNSAFYGCTSLTSIEIPDGVTLIGDSAFYGCTSLASIEIPNSVTSIGHEAFRECTSLTSIKIPNSVTAIGGIRVFYGCAKLASVEIPDSVTSIGSEAFRRCWSLTSIKIPNSVTSIDGSAFYECTNLKSIEIPDSVTFIDSRVFYGCTRLANVKIPDNVTSIDDFAFYECTSLTSIKIPDGVTSIGGFAFDCCNNLISVVIPESVESIKYNSFADNTVWLVYENSYAHKFAVENNLLYFVLYKTENPEISYGKGVTGTVTYTDGTAASGATVDILYDDGTIKESVITDTNGNYEFTYAEVGRYTIRVTDSNGNIASELVSVKRMNAFNVYLAGETDLVLKKGYGVSGTVSPAAAKITISDTNGNVIKSVDATDGAFTFSNIPRGSYIIKAENENGSATTEIYVSNEDVTGISLAIQAQSATITGDIKIENRDETLSAKIWVNVDLIDADGNIIASTKTDAEGKYTFNNVPAGSYNIVATTNEIRPDLIGGFDKSHELKGYGHIDIVELKNYLLETMVLREEKINLTSVSGKVTANGTTQDCQVILTNENGDQIALFVTDNNGKYNFVNIPDGMYCITAITKVDGMGFAVITIKDAVVHGDTDIKVAKADKISKREPVLLNDIPDCETKTEALIYKEAVLAEKAFYDSLSDKERKQLSEQWIEKLFKLVGLIFDSSIQATEGVTVDNVESVISVDEKDETITFTLSVTEASASDAGADGITTDKEYETEKIKDKKGKNKNIAKYYDITFSKDGQNITNIQKQTETNGKLRITMDIPEKHRGHKHYSFIHMHKGEAITLVDLDDNPNTVTFEIDKFSTFALAYSDVELIGEVEETVYPASISYNDETGKISVSTTEAGELFVATYSGGKLDAVNLYPISVGTTENICAFGKNQAAFFWNQSLKPLCEKFTINN